DLCDIGRRMTAQELRLDGERRLPPVERGEAVSRKGREDSVEPLHPLGMAGGPVVVQGCGVGEEKRGHPATLARARAMARPQDSRLPDAGPNSMNRARAPSCRQPARITQGP